MHKIVILFLAMSYSIVSHSSAPTIDEYLDRATPDMYDQYINQWRLVRNNFIINSC